MNTNDPFYFDKTDLFNRLKRLETILGLNNDFNADDIDVRINSLEQTLNTINQNYTTRTYVDNRLLEKVNKAGDTLLGNLSLLVEPIENNQLITKEYVDTVLTQITDLNIATEEYVDAIVVNKVSKFGDTLYGELLLSDNATKPLHPVTKQQFDESLNNVAISGNFDW